MHIIEALVDFGKGPVVSDILVNLDLPAEVVYFCNEKK